MGGIEQGEGTVKIKRVIPVLALVAALALSSCVPPYHFSGVNYATHEEMIAAVNRGLDVEIPKTPMASEKIDGSLLVALPDLQFISRNIVSSGIFVPESRVVEHARGLEVFVLRIPEAMEVAGLFDEIATVQSSNPMAEPIGEKDYKFWYEVNKGEIGSWYLSRKSTGGKAVVARERQWQFNDGFAALNELIVKAALELGATTQKPAVKSSAVANPSVKSGPSVRSPSRKGSLIIYK